MKFAIIKSLLDNFKNINSTMESFKMLVYTIYCLDLTVPTISFWYTFRASNYLNPNQASCFVRPDLGLKCLQRLSAGHKSALAGEGVNEMNN